MSLKKSTPQLIKRLSALYVPEKAERIAEKIEKLMEGEKPSRTKRQFTEKDIVLITYADQLRTPEHPALEALEKCIDKYCTDLINTVHILPFYPYSSDDGFSVIDYKKVDPACGSWKNIKSIRKKFRLMFDAVINHISAESSWFKNYLDGKKKFSDFFIEKNTGFDSEKVFRPRALPLFSEFMTKQGKKELWTTFSADQIDLNFLSEKLLLEIIKVLLFYADNGASLLRLDAIAFIWKKSGTPCVHLVETHSLIKLFKDVLKIHSPHVKLVSETNVPYKDNISYFGNGSDEADMIYNFSLPPLLAHAVITQNTSKLRKWANSLITPPGKSTYFNFTASHDGIGVVPAKDFLDEDDINILCQSAVSRGGFVSMKSLPGGKEIPYELNINYFDFLTCPDDSENTAINKFMLSQCVMLTMPGVPGIYFHSLFGSHNDIEGAKKSGIKRRINREKFEFSGFMSEMEKTSSHRKMVYECYKKLLELRKTLPQLSPYSDFSFPYISNKVFAIRRKNLLALFNFSEKTAKAPVQQAVDLISGKIHDGTLAPWQSVWLEF